MRCMQDPFAVLGLPSSATLAEVRAARRRLAKSLHPDQGGDEMAMRDVNRAFDLAVKSLLRAPSAPSPTAAPPTPPARSSRGARTAPPPPRPRPRRISRRVEHDAPSFSIELLPAEAFEALLIVVGWIGQVLVDDPPYLLDAHLYEPSECWCRIELLPEAGASMVSLTVAGLDDDEAPLVDDVRDVLVASLNDLGSP